jgi:hypothetical protein
MEAVLPRLIQLFVACSMLAEKIKTPEQRYLVISAIGAGIGALKTAWQDYRKGRERQEREAERQCWRERIESKRTYNRNRIGNLCFDENVV